MLLLSAVVCLVVGLASGIPTGANPQTYQYVQLLPHQVPQFSQYVPSHFVPNGQYVPNRLFQLQPAQQPQLPPIYEPAPVATTEPVEDQYTPAEDQYTIIDNEAGKANVKLLYVAKEGNKYTIKELVVRTALTLTSEKEYRRGDNTDVIATDSQKNTVNIFAKTEGVGSPESFGVRLAKHFLAKYPMVTRAEIQINEKPWERIMDAQGRKHNHAFVNNPTSTRYAEVEFNRAGELRVSAGIRGLTILKTTQSGFEDFVSDEFRTLPDQPDRVVSTVVTADWTYSDVNGLDFDKTWRSIQDIILDQWAGPVENGVYSASVQYTQHLMQKAILDYIPQVERVTIDMPNRHYFSIDFTKFPIDAVQGEGAGEVLLPVDNPTGFITSTLVRSEAV